MQHIRNFSIIAHIDHGKTTLTDCFLKLTKTVDSLHFQDRLMDSNPIERERGITIKLAPVRMEYEFEGQHYQLNLIDTPGHVDFGYEVSRSLAACEGVVLIVDATQGIQAQTLSNYEQARALGLAVVPVINKIDLPAADTERVTLELMELIGCQESDIVGVSAKTGLNVHAVLSAIIKKIPAPVGDPKAPTRALLITSLYDQHKGAVALVRVIDGAISSRQKLGFVATGLECVPLEVGAYRPGMVELKELLTGEVGYVATGLKNVQQLKIGDTISSAEHKTLVAPLPGYKEPKPMVYMEVYPIENDDFTLLQEALEKLSLRDAALQYTGTTSLALGSGYRVGFLGILHAEIVLERLSREFGVQILATSPSVTYQITKRNGEAMTVHTPAEMPDPGEIAEITEPWAELRVYTPTHYAGDILTMIRERRGRLEKSVPLGERTQLVCMIPLAEIITDFHDKMKSLTSGYASVEYDLIEYQPVDAVKVTVMLNKEVVEALSFMTVRDQAESAGRRLVDKLKEVLPRQMFEVPIQAAIGGTVIARETLKAFRKDVTAKLYGGDVTRRKKLLTKQAKGKKKMKQFGKVEVSQETFMEILKRT